jgi:hypothetical protein
MKMMVGWRRRARVKRPAMSLLLEIGCEVEVGEEQKRKERNQE